MFQQLPRLLCLSPYGDRFKIAPGNCYRQIQVKLEMRMTADRLKQGIFANTLLKISRFQRTMVHGDDCER